MISPYAEFLERPRDPRGRLAPYGEKSAVDMDDELNAAFTDQMCHIYALLDPRNRLLRYIGKSVRPYQRLQNHWGQAPSNCHRSHWLEELKREKAGRPLLVILESVPPNRSWQTAEKDWISRLQKLGCRLVNNTSGGDGVCSLPPETRQRMRQVWLGRKHRPETLAKLSAASRGRKQSAASKAKRIATLKAVEHRPEWNERVAQAVRKLTEEDLRVIISELRAGVKGIELARRYGVHRTTLSKVKMGTYLDRYRKKSVI